MARQQELSNVTQKYLCRFKEILDTMICGMTTANLTNSISHNFIVQMIPHHRAAIEMCENLLQYTTCIPLQNIACNIINEQTKSIENMQSVLGRCSQCTNTRQNLCQYQQRFRQITQTMFSEMGNACATNDINANFIREMIPHHEGAIRMCKNALCFNICPELKPILEAIITSQERGIKEMKCLLESICED